VLVQVGLGSAYAWSVFRNPLSDAFGWSISEVTFTFSLFILTAGLTSVVGGLWLERSGPRAVLAASGFLYGGGVALSGLSDGRLWVLYVSYGVLAGAGMGLGYIVPIATLQRWFPERRGVVNGIAVCGIPAGALLAAPVARSLIDRVGVLDALSVLGIGYGAIVVGAGLVLREPVGRERPTRGGRRDRGLREALRSWQWYALWGLFLLSVIAGVGLISQAAPMAQEIGDVGAAAAAGIVSVAFVGDALGRLTWPWASDVFGRRRTFCALCGLQSVTFVAMTFAGSYVVFAVLAALVLFNYGGSSGLMAPFVGDVFGLSRVGSIYGLMLTAWGLGGVIGPLLIAEVRQATGSYDGALWVLAACMPLAAVLALSLRPRAALD
jgi:MFS transporter, OFA family, oxalate/formate antiporter